MLSHSPSQIMRVRRFKVKHAGQICLLLVIFMWFVYQVRHMYNKSKEYAVIFPPKVLPKSIEIEEGVRKFRRKDVISSLKDMYLLKGREENDEESGEDVKDVKDDDDGEEEQDITERSGPGDDKIDDDDESSFIEEDPKSELEDLIDVQDQVNDAEDTTQELEDGGQALGSDNGKNMSSSDGQGQLFFRDGLIDLNENSNGEAQADIL
ncbi:hypothetical protein SAY86_021473 [Trapa natans]|uniref:Uncharacterized protein n=1 Tax=Trapa natans TaxID=22666 RepID=A0AAN7RK60_TRANT|nr:hypothetical protein SAY86_021473 [Trapa natans]